ncbi:5294_t:CDS:2, partial [Dentiscutata heterogama]
TLKKCSAPKSSKEQQKTCSAKKQSAANNPEVQDILEESGI